MTGPDNEVFLTLPEALAWGKTRNPPDTVSDFLLTLHELCSSGGVQAIGYRGSDQRHNALVPIPSADWIELYFDSDGEQLRSGDLFSGMLHGSRAWTSARFSLPDLIRKWPKAGAAAFVSEQADKYWGDRHRARDKRNKRERWRLKWIDRFAAKQQLLRLWISFVEIADTCARAASPVTSTEEDEARALAYRRLVESIARGEFERNGRSKVLLLLPELAASVPPHRLSRQYFREMVDAYGAIDFTSNSRLVRENLWFCWLPSDLCREWFARHRLIWPDEFNPKDQTLGARPRSRDNNPNLEISEPPDVSVPEKGRRGRKTRSGSFDDDQALREMLRLLASNKAPSVHAAACHAVTAGIPKMIRSKESAVTRLRRKFADRFGTEPPPGKTWSDIARESETK